MGESAILMPQSIGQQRHSLQCHHMTYEDKIKISSYLLVATFAIVAVVSDLFPGVLFVCLGYLLADGIIGAECQWSNARSKVAAFVVIVSPLIVLGFTLANAKGMAINAMGQYASLMSLLASTVLDLREKLPSAIALRIPDELSAVQVLVADYIQSQSSSLTHLGKVWLEGIALSYVGFVVGALMRTSEKSPNPAPLRREMRLRGLNFIASFRQIVIAQIWIAIVNTVCTAIFLFALLPMLGVSLPYSLVLVLFTFCASLFPVVGNLMCNGVLALTGASVAPWVGLICLVFLILVHKAEYLISAKVLGKKTNTSVWELLAVIFVGEILFGMIGLIAAPLYYTYIKRELALQELI